MSEPESDSNQLSRQTTPTWEMELLISGATVFGLLQLPMPLNRWLFNISQEHDEAVFAAIKIFSMYIQISLWILIITFVLHLFMRGYWIALVGMNSVYPGGIQSDKLQNYGPIYRKTLEKKSYHLFDLIESADNRATVVFGLGFGVAMTILVLSLLMTVVIAVLLMLQMLAIDTNWRSAAFVALGMLIGPFLIAYLLDNYFGKQLLQKNRSLWLEKIFSWYSRIGFGRNGNVLINLFRAHQTKPKSYVLFLALLLVALSSVASVKYSKLDSGAYRGLPSTNPSSAFQASIEHYASLKKEADIQSTQPFIDSMVIDGPYLRLFIPYVPRQLNAVIAKQCPDASIARAANSGLGLKCLANVYRVSIDGQLLAINLLSSSDPSTGQRGMMAMIPLQALAAGQHEIVLSSPQTESDDEPEKPLIIRIPFWK